MMANALDEISATISSVIHIFYLFLFFRAGRNKAGKNTMDTFVRS
jgi:hypothetical protein